VLNSFRLSQMSIFSSDRRLWWQLDNFVQLYKYDNKTAEYHKLSEIRSMCHLRANLFVSMVLQWGPVKNTLLVWGKSCNTSQLTMPLTIPMSTKLCVCVHVCAMRENVYLQALLEAGRLVLGVFGNGGVWATAFTGPRLRWATGIPVLIGRLLNLSPHFHCMVRIGLHQRFGGEQTKVYHRETKARELR